MFDASPNVTNAFATTIAVDGAWSVMTPCLLETDAASRFHRLCGEVDGDPGGACMLGLVVGLNTDCGLNGLKSCFSSERSLPSSIESTVPCLNNGLSVTGEETSVDGLDTKLPVSESPSLMDRFGRGKRLSQLLGDVVGEEFTSVSEVLLRAVLRDGGAIIQVSRLSSRASAVCSRYTTEVLLSRRRGWSVVKRQR